MESSQAKGLIKGLETWAKKVTTGYRDVNVRDMSSSFRDGLAFCAIIHHYRPDLIDFESLSKENILQNNSLAFSTAEKQLGVPALLDAEDMVKYSRPDRLSIITYLSQLHNCFVNQNKVNSLKPGVRIRSNNTDGPPPKIPAMEPKILALKRHEVCHVCKHRVFILERLIVDSKLYHTACFRCNKCKCLLNPGAYVESDTPGLYECAFCLPDESSSSMETQDSESCDSSGDKFNSLDKTPLQSPSPLIRNKLYSKSPLTESVTHARSNFLQNSLSAKSSEGKMDSTLVLKKDSPFFKDSPPASKSITPPTEDVKSVSVKIESVDIGASVKDKINVFETNRNSRSESLFKSGELISSTKLNQSSDINASNGETLPLNIAKTIADVSSNSPCTVEKNIVVQNNVSIEKPAKTFSSGNLGTTSTSDIKTVPKSDLTWQLKKDQEKNTSDNLNLQNDQPSCDNATPVSLRNKVPSPAHLRHSLQFQTFSTDSGTNKVMPKQFQIGDYKSPLKTSRDIFQTNIQPLKLSLSSVSTKREPMITSPDSSSSFEIPQIRSTYARTLPRQSSAGSLSEKDHLSDPVNSSDSNLTDVLHSKWSRTTPRRSSLESQNQNTSTLNTTIKDSLQKEESKSLTEVNVNNSSISPKTSSPITYTKQGSNVSNIVSPFSSRLNDLPVPKLRHSLEIKKISSNSELTTVDSLIKLPDSPSIQVAAEKQIQSEVTAHKPSEQNAGACSSSVSSDSVNDNKTETTKVDEKVPPEKLYPDDLNPFGDDMEEETYPDDLNPFADDEVVTPSASIKVTADNYDESKNPFASDEDDINTTPIQTKPVSPRSTVTSPNSPFSKLNGTYSSPTGSLRGTTKKRLAPKPPKLSDIFPTDSHDSEADVSLSVKSSPSTDRSSLHTPSPKTRRSKPTAPPPPIPTGRQTSQTDLAASTKQMKEADNFKIKSTSSNDGKEVAKSAPRKKRPAPPVPIPKRKDNKKIPLKEILKEMKEIEEKQRECERQGRELELLIRDKDKDEEPSVEEEEYIMQLFELVNQKNALFRRQAELMYIKRSQRLEEQQAEVQMQIRELMMMPAEDKTEEDKAKEDMLILELKDIVDQRSSIIDSIEMDRRRELEEDASVQEQLEIKNGDLPITAEIKEKSSGKVKKEKKAKKEKKEKKKNKKK